MALGLRVYPPEENVGSPSGRGVSAAASQARISRWQSHLEEAHVVLTLVDDSCAETRERPLFQQETQLHYQPNKKNKAETEFNEHESDIKGSETDQVNDHHEDGDDANALVFRCAEFVLKTRAEYWHHPLSLGLTITIPGNAPEPPPVSTETYLSESFVQNHLLRLIREQTMPTPSLTRRIEQVIHVSKPLQIKMETRYVGKERVCIVAKAMNCHATLEVDVLDLQLHLNQPSFSARTARVKQQPKYGKGFSEASVEHEEAYAHRRFRVVNDSSDPFPIQMQPKEQYNFLHVLEAIDSPHSHEGHDKQIRKRVDDRRHQSSRTAASDSEDIRVGRGTSNVAQQTLLTLSWQPRDSSTVITEHHTVIWNPRQPDPSDTTTLENASPSGEIYLNARGDPLYPIAPDTAARNGGVRFSCVKMDKDSPLRVALTLVPTTHELVIGRSVTLCALVSNRSSDSSFDLTLVFSPPKSDHTEHPHSASSSGMDLNWLGFEASHRLGYVLPIKTCVWAHAAHQPMHDSGSFLWLISACDLLGVFSAIEWSALA